MATMIVDISSEKLRVVACTAEGKMIAIPNEAGKLETQLDMYANPNGKIAFGVAPADFYQQGFLFIPDIPYELSEENLFVLNGGKRCSGIQVMYMAILRAKIDLQNYLDEEVSGIGFVIPAVYSSWEYNLLRQITENLHCRMVLYIRAADALGLYQYETAHIQEQREFICHIGPRHLEFGIYSEGNEIVEGEEHGVLVHSMKKDLSRILTYPFEQTLQKAQLSDKEYHIAIENLRKAAKRVMSCRENSTVTIQGREIHKVLSKMEKMWSWKDICNFVLPHLDKLIQQIHAERKNWGEYLDPSVSCIVIGGDAARYPILNYGLRRSINYSDIQIKIADTSATVFAVANYYGTVLQRSNPKGPLLLNSLPHNITLKLKKGYKILIFSGTNCPFTNAFSIKRQNEDIQLVIYEHIRPILACCIPAKATPCKVYIEVSLRGIVEANVRYSNEIILHAMHPELVKNLDNLSGRLPREDDID